MIDLPTISQAELRTLTELCTLSDDDEMTAGVVADTVVDGVHYASIASLVNKGLCTFPTEIVGGDVRPTPLGRAVFEANSSDKAPSE